MPPTHFKDLFSHRAGDYAKYRPRYPKELFQLIADTAPSLEQAWDCGTGNGQAALGLAEHFNRVTATDASQKQIEQAFSHPRVTYLVAPAEKAPIHDNSLDAITVAQALHWFNLDVFYQEVRRSLKPDGVIAVWCYGRSLVEPDIDRVVEKLYSVTLRGYWDPVVTLVDNKYRTIPFPFKEIEAPDFAIQSSWNLQAFFGYLKTWSALQKCITENSFDILQPALDEVAALWGNPQSAKTITTRLHLRIGRFVA